MEKITNAIAMIGVGSLILILFTPLIWIWVNYEMFEKSFSTLSVIFIAMFIIQKLINESKKE
jgi:hypothetical protein